MRLVEYNGNVRKFEAKSKLMRLPKAPKRPKIDVLGVKVADISQKKAVKDIISMVKAYKNGYCVVTVNSEFVMLARQNRRFLDVLNKADLAVADGSGVVLAKLIFGGKAQDRIAGVELVEKLCQESAKNVITVGFLGGFEEVADMAAKRQKAVNPKLIVAYAGPGDPSMGYDLRLKEQLDAVGRIDILFVAYGMGRQEFWIWRNRKRLNVGVFIGVGGAFDYLSMVKKRAPLLWQKWGMEWLWRLAAEPWRFWRMRVLPIFWVLVGLKVLSQKLRLFRTF